MTAWINGFLGVALTLAIGTLQFGMEPGTLARILLVNFASGLLSPLAILKLEGIPWVRQNILTRSLKTWAIFVTLYFGGNLLLSPELRSWPVFGWLGFPLILATGFSILAFGPIQDGFVRRRQRLARARR